MFIFTAKLRPRALAAAAAAGALACCVLISLTLSPGPAVQASGSAQVKGIRTNEDRISFLQSYGWEVSPEPLFTEELLLPDQLDESYTDYLSLQHSQGFALEDYAGKRLKRYTYAVTNYPSGQTDVQANLLIYRNTVVGGEILSPSLDGFVHALEMP